MTMRQHNRILRALSGALFILAMAVGYSWAEETPQDIRLDVKCERCPLPNMTFGGNITAHQLDKLAANR